MALDETALDAAWQAFLSVPPPVLRRSVIRETIEAYLDSLGEIEPVEAPKPEFASGDIVRCVWDEQYGEVVLGHTYIVERIGLTGHVYFAGNTFGYPPEHFELVSKAAQMVGVEATVAYGTVNLSDETITKLATAFWTSPDRRRTPRTL